MSSLLAEIERVVSKPPDQRTDREMSSILPWFRKKSDLFRSLRLDAVVDILRNSELIKRPTDNVLIKQGDKGDCFFTILTGKVSIYITNKDDEEDEIRVCRAATPLAAPTEMGADNSKFQDTEEPRRGSLKYVMSNTEMFPKIPAVAVNRLRASSIEVVVEAFHHPSMTREDKPLDRSKYGQFVGCIDEGKSFGELALIRKDCIRNASIITDMVTQLLVVNRQLYNRCIRDSQEKEFNTVHTFVKTCEHFQDWSDKYKKLMAMSMRLVVYNYGTTLVSQGQPVDRIIFLNSGQCRLVIDQVQHRHQYPTYFSANDIVRNDRTAKSYEGPGYQRRQTQQRHKASAPRGLDVCLVGHKNIIGDVELAANLPTYLQSVICEEETEGFSLDLRNYERLITRRHPHTGRKLQVEAMLKLNHRALGFRQIPILGMIIKRQSAENRLKFRRRDNNRTALHNFGSSTNLPRGGPLIDMYGEGTVFHYIRIKRKQIKNSKLRGRNTQPSTAAETKTVKESISLQLISAGEHEEEVNMRGSPSLLLRLYMKEEERRARLEERILAWHSGIQSLQKRDATAHHTQFEPSFSGTLLTSIGPKSASLPTTLN